MEKVKVNEGLKMGSIKNRRGNNMNLPNLLRNISVLLLICFCISSIVDPAYAWKGTSNEVEYEVFLSKFFGPQIRDMETNQDYKFEIAAKKGSIPIDNLRIVLPDGFKLIATNTHFGFYSITRSINYFEILSPATPGEYLFLFNGKDENKENVNFSIPINVISAEEVVSSNSQTEGRIILGAIGLFIGISLLFISAGPISR